MNTLHFIKPAHTKLRYFTYAKICTWAPIWALQAAF